MSKALTVQTEQALSTIPAHLQADMSNRDGKDGLGDGDVIIPRLKLAQNLSNEMKKSHESYNQELEEGDFFNSATGEIYGPEVNVIPLHFFNEYVEFDPTTRKPVKFYEKGEVPPANELVYVAGQKPKCTNFKSRMALLLREDGSVSPIVVSFKYVGPRKTATSKWNTLIAEKNGPAYGYVYKLESTTVSNDKGEWAGAKFTRGGFTPAALYEGAKRYYAELQNAGVKVDMSGLDNEQEETDTSFDQEG